MGGEKEFVSHALKIGTDGKRGCQFIISVSIRVYLRFFPSQSFAESVPLLASEVGNIDRAAHRRKVDVDRAARRADPCAAEKVDEFQV